MATNINDIKDASGKSINDYKADYEKARQENNADAMEAANKAANAIREQNNVQTEVASADIANTRKNSSSSSKTTTSTAPANFQGSATGVQTSTAEQDLIKAQMNQNSIAWHEADEATKKLLEEENRNLAAQLGLNAAEAFDPVTGTWSGTAAAPAQPTQAQPANTSGMQDLLNQWKDAATAQNTASIDYNVQKAINDLQRALADAQPQFKEQAEQVARDEMQGRDNAALYAELRGDKGGIGQEQYSSIMNTAAQNRLTVQQAQTQMATEVDRQIADLRAQGEFEKADAALEIAQQYLSQLLSLEQWAASYNLSVAEFNESVRQWGLQFEQALKEYDTSLELSKAQLTGMFKDGTTTLQAQDIVRQQMVESGKNLLAYGIMPSDEQLTAMGYSKEQATQMVNEIKLERAAAAAAAAAKGKSDDESDPLKEMTVSEVYQTLFDLGYTRRDEAAIKAYLMTQGLSASLADSYAGAYVGSEYNKLANAKPKVATVDDPDALKSLQQTLSRIEDSLSEASVPARAKDEIQKLFEKGKITEETATKLLRQYGYSV